MIVYYAFGSGLGHLTRAQAVLHTLRLHDDVTLLSSSKFAGDPRVMGHCNVRQMPAEMILDPARTREWINRAIEDLQPSEFYIDAFPVGLVGEFADSGAPYGIPTIYVARLLRWDRYAKLLPENPRFVDKTLIVEPLTDDHQEFVDQCSRAQSRVELVDPPQLITRADLARLDNLTAEPFWLVAHSAPPAEIYQLVTYAQEMQALERRCCRILLATDTDVGRPLEGVTVVSMYPLAPLIDQAERVITACGYNSMRQLAPYAKKHRFLPFERRFDDQFLRAARRLHANNAQLVGTH